MITNVISRVRIAALSNHVHAAFLAFFEPLRHGKISLDKRA